MARTTIRWDWLIAGALASCVLAGPAHATDAPITPYPGESRDDFVARAHVEQLRKLSEADQAAAAADPGGSSGGAGLASVAASGALGGTGGLVSFGGIGLIMLVGWGIRMSLAVNRASRSLTRAGGLHRAGDSFEDRLAERLREMDQSAGAAPPMPALAPIEPRPMAAVEPPVVAAAVAQPGPAISSAPRLGPGVRTFGRRAT